MYWLIVIPGFALFAVALVGYVNTRRMLSRYLLHLEKTRNQLEQQFRQRRHLLPSFIALGAGVPGLEHECLETLDNAAELVIRSKGFEERLVAENRLSSALYHLRARLERKRSELMPDLVSLIGELDNREAGIMVAGDVYNRQMQDFSACFQKFPHRWIGAFCGYRPPHAVEIRLSTTPILAGPRNRKKVKENTS